MGSVLHATQGLLLYGTAHTQQLNNVNIDCVVDCIPKYPTHIDKNEKMSQYSLSVFCLVLLQLQYQQGQDEFKEKKLEIGIKEH